MTLKQKLSTYLKTSLPLTSNVCFRFLNLAITAKPCVTGIRPLGAWGAQ